jgi:hypothetical protein
MARLLFSLLAVCLATLSVRDSSAQQRDDPVVFLGELRSVTLSRPDFEAINAPRPDGSIVISNSCGEETAVLRVLRSTAPLAPMQTLHFSIGEWCEAPIEFPHDHWLIIPGAAPDGAPVQYPVFVSDEAVFALVEDEAAYRRLPTGLQRRLPLERLPSPVEYPIAVDLEDAHDRQFIERQSSVEIRNNEVWLVRAILLTNLFPDLSENELRRASPLASYPRTPQSSEPERH